MYKRRWNTPCYRQNRSRSQDREDVLDKTDRTEKVTWGQVNYPAVTKQEPSGEIVPETGVDHGDRGKPVQEASNKQAVRFHGGQWSISSHSADQ